MDSRLPFPIISVEGKAYERGVQYGVQARSIIENLLENYPKALKERANLDWSRALELAKKFLPAIESYDPEVIEEMKGIAEGAKRPFAEILFINTRSELMFLARSGGEIRERPEGNLDGCTVMAATPEVTESGHMIVGHNVDWLPSSGDNYVILKKRISGGLNIVSILEAGIVGKSGFNSAGIVAFGNALITDKVQFGVPVQILANKVLGGRNVADACMRFLPPYRGSSLNRLIADESGLCVDVEMSPAACNYMFPEEGVLVHTNHFAIQNAKINDLMRESRPDSFLRRDRALRLLNGARGHITIDTFKKIFSDHQGYPHSVCQHPDEGHPEMMRIETVLSNIYDVNERTLYIAKGRPCESEYHTLDFSDFLS